MTNSPLAQLTALPAMSMAELKALWRSLHQTEPPAYNRAFLERRLAYRLQELAYGGLSPATVERLDALADGLEGRDTRQRVDRDRPIPGTQLVREWQGSAHTVTVTREGYDYAGRPYRSLSAVARAITGTRWNGPLFFGLRRAGAA